MRKINHTLFLSSFLSSMLLALFLFSNIPNVQAASGTAGSQGEILANLFLLDPENRFGEKNGRLFVYNLLVQDFSKTEAADWIAADINSDGKVDIFDYNILVENFGR